MLHPTVMMRPDDIIRSGIIQPFTVRGMDPVQFARHEIDPFITAIRPEAAQYLENNKGLGVVSANVVPLYGFGEVTATEKLLYLVGGVALGALIGFFVGRRK